MLDLSACVVLSVSQDVCSQRWEQKTRISTSSPWLWCFSYILRILHPPSLRPHAVYSSDKPSAEVVCFSLHAIPSADRFACQCSTNYLMHAGCPAWAAAHCRHEARVFTPGSLSACRQIMGRARGSPLLSSPHHSFAELISFSLWPAMIYSPVYFMAHFKISASLYFQPTSTLAAVFGVLWYSLPLTQRKI